MISKNIHKWLVKIFNNNKYCVGKLLVPIHNIVYKPIGCPVNIYKNIHSTNKITL